MKWLRIGGLPRSRREGAISSDTMPLARTGSRLFWLFISILTALNAWLLWNDFWLQRFIENGTCYIRMGIGGWEEPCTLAQFVKIELLDYIAGPWIIVVTVLALVVAVAVHVLLLGISLLHRKITKQ